MSLAILARKHNAKKKASQGKCFYQAMTNRGSVRRSKRRLKKCAIGCKEPCVNSDISDPCSPFVQNSYRNHLRKLTQGCNKVKCSPDKPASDATEKRKAMAIKDLKYNYASQCLSCKIDCNENNGTKKLCDAFPPLEKECQINRQDCKNKAQLSRLHVKRNWCNTIANDLGMRGSNEHIAILKAKVLTCRNEDGSAKTACECVKTKKSCG